MSIKNTIATLALGLGLVGTSVAHAGLPTSGVEVRTGKAADIVDYDQEVDLVLPHSGMTKIISKTVFHVDALPVGVQVHLCRLDTVVTCHDITGLTDGTLHDWDHENTLASYEFVFIAPGTSGVTLPVAGPNATVKLYFN